MLRRDEVRDALFDYGNGWAVGVEPAGPLHWPAEIERRKGIIAALASKAPPPAMNEPPAVITEPFTIMLFGITTEPRQRVAVGLARPATSSTGMAASPGRAEGIARVVLDAADLADVQEGEILVTRVTAPSWGPVFDRAAAGDHRHRRHDEPRGDRLPRVRPAGGDRDRLARPRRSGRATA